MPVQAKGVDVADKETDQDHSTKIEHQNNSLESGQEEE